VQGLSQGQKSALRVAIVARSAAKAAQIALIANARAGVLSSGATFEAVEIAEFEAAALSRVFRTLKPKVIFQTASLQSPWESAGGQNSWTKLVAAAGFGITLPLQMALTAEVSRAGWPYRASFFDMRDQFEDLMSPAERKLVFSGSDLARQQLIKKLMVDAGFAPESYAIGRTKVFGSAGLEAELGERAADFKARRAAEKAVRRARRRRRS
jgi:hypothetical protein